MGQRLLPGLRALSPSAAPMPVEVASYFGSLDIDLLDVYGMSECTGAASMS